jgi:hypothetical protein
MEPRWRLLSEACGKGHVNVFFAGSGFTYDLAYDAGVRKRLLSWHANTPDDIEEYRKAQEVGRESFGIVDSGAFTVWNKGGSIDVNEYGNKLLELLQFFDVAANLDVIPGKKGMAASDITSQITDKAASEGWANFQKLSAKLYANGINPQRLMPIYHQGESLDWLRRMVAHGCEYIGVSPSNDYATSQRQLWLDTVYDYLLSLPKLPKTHGYAVTSPVLMKQYPWFSVDSASWVQQGGYGTVNTPFGVVTLSDRETAMGRAESMNGRSWSPEMKEKLAAYFQGIGLDVEQLKASFHERWKANAIYMLNLEKQMLYKKKQKPTALFAEEPQLPVAPKPHPNEPTAKQDAFGLTLSGKPPKGDGPMSLFDAR